MSDLSKIHSKTKGTQGPLAMVLKSWLLGVISDLILLVSFMFRLITENSLHHSYGGSDRNMFGAGQRMGNGKTPALGSSAHGKWSWTSESLSLAIKERNEILCVVF